MKILNPIPTAILSLSSFCIMTLGIVVDMSHDEMEVDGQATCLSVECLVHTHDDDPVLALSTFIFAPNLPKEASEDLSLSYIGEAEALFSLAPNLSPQTKSIVLRL